MRRVIVLLAILFGLSACSSDGAKQLQAPVEPLGNFRLGFAEVVAPNLVKGPASRDATKEEWIAAMDEALETRFKRYEGDHFYHIGASVEGFVLAQPGIPLVLSPKSALILRVTIWDDATQTKLNEETELITALEQLSGETLVGSGLTQSKKQQMDNLTANAALLVERWMRSKQKSDGWFGGLAANQKAVDAAVASEAITAQ
ncbi:hypothetical protein [Pseudoprimorskyibacter insulae]|uniref:DUF3313 domain-containing protein n=1 Tax=Pseudoprimorskyibacter insulae TaxID=1695997 RepID=A0A2R8ANV3_9RHOB|nr:hypothetical protein [Pseudoprimorskyibacter insulae]SPF77731.1 hypothetical protein PRI8871_00315 [Pseudoprimorskyibacter insulae]